jgi:hypothetical protein
MSGTELDLSKLQALLFTLIVAIAMVGTGVTAISKFSVPDTVLEILGLSQIVFVGGNFTKPTNLGDLDNLITQARQRLAQLRAAARSGVDVASDGTIGLEPPIAGAPFADFNAAKVNLPNASQRYLDVAEQIKTLLESLSHRSADPTNLLDPPL